MPPSNAVEDDIRKRASKLDRYYGRVTSCRVVVQAPHPRKHHGKIYHVTVDLTLPGTKLVVNRDREFNHAHEDVYVAIRDAFHAAEHRIKSYVGKHFQETHPHPSEDGRKQAKVIKLFPMEDYGFLETPEGKEVFFHRNAVLNEAFDRLDIGTEVHFVEELGEKGPQASTVLMD